MSLSRFLLIILVALGTYLMRFLPLKWQEKLRTIAHFSEFFEYSTAALLAALFVTAFWELPFQSVELWRRTLSLFPVFFSFALWRNLGLSIVLGILTHFFLSFLF